MDMAYVPAPKNDGLQQSVLFLLVVLGWHYVIFLMWDAINLYVRKQALHSSATEMANIYKIADWFGTGSTIILMLVLAIIVKNNTVRIFLIILVLIRIAMTLSYTFIN
jgi:hypothetical protein